MKLLTVTLATHNEEPNIARCFSSFYGIADEIIVVDGMSNDGTVEAVQKADPDKKVKLIPTENLENFHIMKQMANDEATCEWILQMDADEVLSSELQKEIKETISLSDAKDGYWMPRLNFFLMQPLRKGGQYPDKTLRLYRRGKGRLPCKDIHEQAEITGTVGTLNSDLLHYPYPTFKIFIEKWLRYASMEAHRAYDRGERPSTKKAILYCVFKPKMWFLKTYFRHKGFQDGLAGFMFSLFSALRFVVEYAFLYERAQNNKSSKL